MVSIRALIGASFLVLGWSVVGAAQTPPLLPTGHPAAPPPRAEPSADVVVVGLRDIEAPDSAVTHRTLGSNKTGLGAAASRKDFDLEMRYARCALRPKGSEIAILRKIIDDPTNSARQRFWQQRLLWARSACAGDPRQILPVGQGGDSVRGGTAGASPIGQNEVGAPAGFSGLGNEISAYYQRGALTVRALQLFAPNLQLTAAMTADPAVQARFNAREVPLSRFRLPVDRFYFETAVCLVRLQPELSAQLARTTEAYAVARLEAAVVDRARTCVGNAKHVYFDPTQFRFYIADAVYRWAVAAQGTDTLIPDDRIASYKPRDRH